MSASRAMLRSWFVLVGSLIAFSATPVEFESIDSSLRRADTVKVSSYSEFESIIDGLSDRSVQMTPSQAEYLRYLKGWRLAYQGKYQESIALLNEIVDATRDVTIRLRATATIVNVTVLSKQYETAFLRLRQLLELLPQVSDKGAREQALSVIAYVYNNIGDYPSAQSYARMLRQENWGGRGACTGGQLELQAQFGDGNAQLTKTQFEEVISACEQIGEDFRSNIVRVYAAKRLMSEGRFDEAIQLLQDNYKRVVSFRSPRVTSEYEALLAQAYRQTGNSTLARSYALRAIDTSVKNEYTEPLVLTYRLLYLLAKEQGDAKSALAYHEKYMTADKGYLDDVSARQLAFQRVKQEVEAGKAQIESLNRENQVLQLQRQLSDKAVENIRLYIAMLVITLIFIALWAYKTKRSQLHFKKLSQRDGLTGIFNRPHFMDIADATLRSAERNREEVCIVLCDLDHFKAVNDNYGHAEGDYVLQRAVNACQTHLRTGDLFARLGGEEFGVVLPRCTLDEARVRAEHLRRAVSEGSRAPGKFDVSASFGIATTEVSGYSLQTLLTHADVALYRAKRSGRNCVAVYEPVLGAGSEHLQEDGAPEALTVN